MTTVTIPCVCGKSYNVNVGPKLFPVGHVNKPTQRHKCPKCGHVWNLCPGA
jgi:hypothetical protein